MKVVTNYPDGVFSWVDLTTTDVAAAKAFYTGLFGWEAEDRPIDGGGVYVMFSIEGHSVAGMGAMQEEMRAQGVPSHWVSYVKHDDVNAVAEKVTAAGGTMVLPPMDVMQEGRMLMAQDPSGAMFGVWQPANHKGAGLVNMPNTLVWNELQTRDIAATKKFYADVFDWGIQTDENDYVMYKADERIQAGSMAIQDSWGPVPSNWAVYFMVEDVDAMAAKVKELGGNLMGEPIPAGEMGKFVVVQDPTGAVFTMMSFSGPVDNPPGH
ncbi:MAG: VOC family protein [Ardenticatenaceae bacterium]|nr:VOC family protein [Ardenticatenaceae bacterium]